MADNTDEEHVDNATNPQSENSPNEIIPTKHTETFKPKEETENMEVHHHSDLHHKPKKRKEYFLEFLMIFLAVTMGFFAESYREHLADREKVKQAIESLVKCLASDTSQLKMMIKSNNLLAQNLDSFLLLKNADLTTEENKKKFYEHGSPGFLENWYFRTNDAAMEQLKSSGMLRLIHDQKIVDAILGYELKNKITTESESDCYFGFKESLTDFKKVADITILQDASVVSINTNTTSNFISFAYKNLNGVSIGNDKEKLKTVFNNASQMSISLKVYVQLMQEQFDYANNLLALLNKEYYLRKNE
ncbi:MAG: hypothetical protein ACHQF0_07375 [Chitinophagales bacterium]